MNHYRGLLEGQTESVFDVLPDAVPENFFQEESSEAKQTAETKESEAQKVEEAAEIKIDDSESTFELAYRKWLDDIMPLQKLAEDERVELKDGQRPDLLARAYQYSARMI